MSIVGRRRKIKCVFPQDSPFRCSGCFQRGVRCIDQSHVDTYSAGDQRVNLRERVARLETLIETLVETIIEEKRERRYAQARTDALLEHFPPTPDSDSAPSTADMPAEGPILSLFDNVMWTRANEPSEPQRANSTPVIGSGESGSQSHFKASPVRTTSNNPAFDNGAPPFSTSGTKHDRLSNQLKATLPSPERLEAIIEIHSNSWAIRRTYIYPNASPEDMSLKLFASRALAENSPVNIAKVVQLVANESDEATFEKTLNLVDRLIIQDDEFISTLDGIECALAQGKMYADCGSARKSWLSFRRAILYAQLLGLHRNRPTARHEMLWKILYMSDRLGALLLGTPYLITDNQAGMDLSINAALTPKSFYFLIAVLSGKVIDQNQNKGPLSSLLEIDEELIATASRMPPDFWQISPLAPKDPVESMKWHEQAMGHAGYLQARIILHIPEMLKGTSGFGRSRDACYESSRELLRIFEKLRAPENANAYKNKGMDFVGFFAAVTLLLGVLGYGGLTTDMEQRERDWKLIDQTMELFKLASTQRFGRIAAQSYQTLKQLTKFREGGHASGNNNATTVVIPFFGAISVQWDQEQAYAEPPQQRYLSEAPTNSTAGTVVPIEEASSAAEPYVAYDGLYMQLAGRRPPGNVVGGHVQPTYDWMSAGGFDIDQDWSWLNQGNAHPGP
jgi:hypothetical protein